MNLFENFSPAFVFPNEEKSEERLFIDKVSSLLIRDPFPEPTPRPIMLPHSNDPLNKLFQNTRADVNLQLGQDIAQFLLIRNEISRLKKQFVKNIVGISPLLASLSTQFDSQQEGELQLIKTQNNLESLGYRQKVELLLAEAHSLAMEKKLTFFLSETLKKQENKNLHKCKICQEEFQSGRQLGGHMSRKHPSATVQVKLRKKIFNSKKLQRERRRYIRSKNKRK